MLGPILFVLYIADVLQLVKDHGLLPHAYTDDTQILGYVVLARLMSYNTMYLTAWTLCHRGWQLTVYRSTARRQHQIPTTPV